MWDVRGKMVAWRWMVGLVRWLLARWRDGEDMLMIVVGELRCWGSMVGELLSLLDRARTMARLSVWSLMCIVGGGQDRCVSHQELEWGWR